MTKNILQSSDACRGRSDLMYSRIDTSAGADFILLCDHASNHMPAGVSLGINDVQLKRHISYDIGIKGVTEMLASSLNCPAIFSKFSRLYIDCNRFFDDPTLTSSVSDGTQIPLNANISDEQKQYRWDNIHQPYQRGVHKLIGDYVDRANGKIPLIVSMHSYTNNFVSTGEYRPWKISVLWQRDELLAKKLIEILRFNTGFDIGDNEPYDERIKCGYTVKTHAQKWQLPSLIIEVRQDIITTIAEQQNMTDILQKCLTKVLPFAKQLLPYYNLKQAI